MKSKLEERVDMLEKKIAELEERIPERRSLNLTCTIELSNADIEKFCHRLQKHQLFDPEKQKFGLIGS